MTATITTPTISAIAASIITDTLSETTGFARDYHAPVADCAFLADALEDAGGDPWLVRQVREAAVRTQPWVSYTTDDRGWGGNIRFDLRQTLYVLAGRMTPEAVRDAKACQEARRRWDAAQQAKLEKLVLQRRRQKALRPVREHIGCSSYPIVIVAGGSAPAIKGRSYHWVNRSGEEIRFPSAYNRKAFSSPAIYVGSTRRIEVGRDWLAANGIVWEGD